MPRDSQALVPQQPMIEEWLDEHGNPMAPLQRNRNGQFMMPQGGMRQVHQGHVDPDGQQYPMQQQGGWPQQGSGQPHVVHIYNAPVIHNVTNNVTIKVIHRIAIRNGRRVVETTTQTVNGAPPGTHLLSGNQRVQYGGDAPCRMPAGQQQVCQPATKNASPLLIAAVIVLALAALYFFAQSMGVGR